MGWQIINYQKVEGKVAEIKLEENKLAEAKVKRKK
jgi:hypothetical protein